jgi:hypothetical protein
LPTGTALIFETIERAFGKDDPLKSPVQILRFVKQYQTDFRRGIILIRNLARWIREWSMLRGFRGALLYRRARKVSRASTDGEIVR